MKTLSEILNAFSTKKELKKSFAKFFKIKLGAKNYIDLYTPQILFEFNLDALLTNLKIRAKCIARTLYYIQHLKYGDDGRAPSKIF